MLQGLIGNKNSNSLIGTSTASRAEPRDTRAKRSRFDVVRSVAVIRLMASDLRIWSSRKEVEGRGSAMAGARNVCAPLRNGGLVPLLHFQKRRTS